jgi:hypothetical protein
MALYDLTDPDVELPQQLVIDSSVLLALRPGDDNPQAVAAQAFMRRLRPRIAALEMVAWAPLPVLQECYHIILTHHLRCVWESLDSATRLPNWLAMYKRIYYLGDLINLTHFNHRLHRFSLIFCS